MKITTQLAQYHRRRKEFIELLGGKCVDCGDDTNLEFDHIDRMKKSFSISRNLSMNYEDLKVEVLKCELRCKNCHLIKTQTVDGLVAKHGSAGMYRHQKCRCIECKKGNTERHRIWRESRKVVS